MRIVCLSDSHGIFNEWESLPSGDVLVIAGDIFPNYSRNHQKDAEEQLRAFARLDARLAALPFKRIYAVGGNHDWAFFVIPRSRRWFTPTKITLLEDEGVTYDGVKVYGFPWTPEFCGWAHMYDRKSQKARAIMDNIHEDTQVLISHGPPHGILDMAEGQTEHLGCEVLAQRVNQLPKLKVHIFGHIHESYGSVEKQRHVKGYGVLDQKQTFANVSLLNDRYQLVNKPTIIDI